MNTINTLFALIVFGLSIPSLEGSSASDNCNIRVINSFESVKFNAIQKRGSKTLVLFDVDNTLLYMNHEEEDLQPFVDMYAKIAAARTVEEKLRLYGSLTTSIESDIYEDIFQLQKSGVPVIACTAMGTGSFIDPNHLHEEWRYEDLRYKGFVGNGGDVAFKLPLYSTRNGYRKPVFYKGLLVTDCANKGPILFDALGALIEKKVLSEMPKEIILFDDQEYQIKSMQTSCREYDLAFTGYLYTRYAQLQSMWYAQQFWQS